MKAPQLLRALSLISLLAGIANVGFAQSYTLSLTPAATSGCIGSIVQTRVRMTASGGFNLPATITFPQLPSNMFVQGVFPNPVSPGNQAVINLFLGELGTRVYDVNVRGKSANGVQASTVFSIDVRAIPGSGKPDIPNITTPPILRPLFRFTYNDLANGAQLQVSTQPDFASTVLDIELIRPNNEFTPIIDLPLGQLYWRIRGINECGRGEWSVVRTFFTQAPVVFVDGMEILEAAQK